MTNSILETPTATRLSEILTEIFTRQDTAQANISGLGDVKAGLRVLGLVAEESEHFGQLVDVLLKNMPAQTDCDGQKTACEIGDALYWNLKATKKE